MRRRPSRLSWKLTNHYEALLFDFDGVLVDSEPVHFDCWKQVLVPLGVDLDWDTYAANCIGVSDRSMIMQFAANLGVDFDKLWAEYPRKKEIFRARIDTDIVVLPETLELIRELAGSYRMAVVSSSNRLEVEPVIVREGVRDCFGALVCGTEVPNLKPAPDPYLRAAELLDANTALVIEDSDAGERSGRAAGFDVLRINSAAELVPRLRDTLAVLK